MCHFFQDFDGNIIVSSFWNGEMFMTFQKTTKILLWCMYKHSWTLLVDKLNKQLRMLQMCFTRVYFLKVHKAKCAHSWRNAHKQIWGWCGQCGSVMHRRFKFMVQVPVVWREWICVLKCFPPPQGVCNTVTHCKYNGTQSLLIMPGKGLFTQTIPIFK